MGGVRGGQLHAGFLFADRPPTGNSLPPQDPSREQHSLGESDSDRGTRYEKLTELCRVGKFVCKIHTHGASSSQRHTG